MVKPLSEILRNSNVVQDSSTCMADIPGGYGGTASTGGSNNNIRGNECEKTIFRALNILGLVEGTDFEHQKPIAYSKRSTHDSINEDFIFPNSKSPKTLLSVTHSNPTIKGHSNENKTHQHIGETWLFKTHNPNVRHISYLGSNFVGGIDGKWWH